MLLHIDSHQSSLTYLAAFPLAADGFVAAAAVAIAGGEALVWGAGAYTLGCGQFETSVTNNLDIPSAFVHRIR